MLPSALILLTAPENGLPPSTIAGPSFAQAPDPFQSAPGPEAPKPKPRPLPPRKAEPQPAAVAPPPASGPATLLARPEGALREVELRQLVDVTRTQTNLATGSSSYHYVAPGGRVFARGINSEGRPFSDNGHWSIENDMWCYQWDHLYFGRHTCFYVFKKGDGYEARFLDGAVSHEFTTRPGNVQHLQ